MARSILSHPRKLAEKPVTLGAWRAARTRRLKKLIAAKVEQARHETFESLIKACAAENPHGSSGAFIRWFDTAWRQAVRHG